MYFAESIDIKTLMRHVFHEGGPHPVFLWDSHTLRFVFTMNRRWIWAYCKVCGVGLPLGFILIDVIIIVIITIFHFKDREVYTT